MLPYRHLAAARWSQHGSDRGVTLVFFAVSLSALLTVGALVLSGSMGYSAARNAQTAADAAALAGTSALQNHKQDWIITPADELLDEIEEVASENGATLEACHLVRATYALNPSEGDVIAECDQLATLPDESFKDAAGVRVSVSDTRDVMFAAFVDNDEITATATAAATIQPVARGHSPFMVCSSPDAIGHPAQAVLPDASDPTGYAVNQAAVGKYFVLWGNQIKELGRDCGKPSSDWRGLVKLPLDGYPLPSTEASAGDDDDWWVGDSGNTTGQLDARIAGGNACTFGDGSSADEIELGCEMAIPLCPKSNESPSEFRLFCVKMGAFRITHVGSATADLTDDPEDSPCGVVTNNIICGEFLGAATAASGRGVAERPDRHGFAVIKLVQ